MGSWKRRQRELPVDDESQAMALIGYIMGAEDALRSLSILSHGMAAQVGKRGIRHVLASGRSGLDLQGQDQSDDG
jgi:hypothetical protein